MRIRAHAADFGAPGDCTVAVAKGSIFPCLSKLRVRVAPEMRITTRVRSLIRLPGINALRGLPGINALRGVAGYQRAPRRTSDFSSSCCPGRATVA